MRPSRNLFLAGVATHVEDRDASDDGDAGVKRYDLRPVDTVDPVDLLTNCNSKVFINVQ